MSKDTFEEMFHKRFIPYLKRERFRVKTLSDLRYGFLKWTGRYPSRRQGIMLEEEAGKMGIG